MSGHLLFFSCGSKSQTSKCYARHPTISRFRRCFFLSSAVWYSHSGIISYSTLYRTDMPTWRGEPLMTLVMCGSQCFWSSPGDPPQYQALLIHNHTTLKCYVTLSNIITSCDIAPYSLFTIHIFFNALVPNYLSKWTSHFRVQARP